VAPSSAKIGSFPETFSQCFFNEMNRPVIIQQVVEWTLYLFILIVTTPSNFSVARLLIGNFR
jgi:hypothetical protein